MWQPIDVQTGRQFILRQSDWPALIHGGAKSGAAYFTVILAAELIRRGEKLVFICASGQAIRSLQTELGISRPAAAYTEVTGAAASSLQEMKLVTLFKRRGTDILASLRALPDWSARVVVIDKVEEILTPQFWAVVRPHPKLILAGDFEKAKTDIDQKIFSTSILFSTAPGHWHHQRGPWPTYIGDTFYGEKRRQLIAREAT